MPNLLDTTGSLTNPSDFMGTMAPGVNPVGMNAAGGRSSRANRSPRTVSTMTPGGPAAAPGVGLNAAPAAGMLPGASVSSGVSSGPSMLQQGIARDRANDAFTAGQFAGYKSKGMDDASARRQTYIDTQQFKAGMYPGQQPPAAAPTDTATAAPKMTPMQQSQSFRNLVGNGGAPGLPIADARRIAGLDPTPAAPTTQPSGQPGQVAPPAATAQPMLPNPDATAPRNKIVMSEDAARTMYHNMQQTNPGANIDQQFIDTMRDHYGQDGSALLHSWATAGTLGQPVAAWQDATPQNKGLPVSMLGPSTETGNSIAASIPGLSAKEAGMYIGGSPAVPAHFGPGATPLPGVNAPMLPGGSAPATPPAAPAAVASAPMTMMPGPQTVQPAPAAPQAASPAATAANAALSSTAGAAAGVAQPAAALKPVPRAVAQQYVAQFGGDVTKAQGALQAAGFNPKQYAD